MTCATTKGIVPPQGQLTRITAMFAAFQHSLRLVAVGLALTFVAFPRAYAQTDALSSWNDTAARKSIVNFVERVTRQGSPDFVPPAERVAVFDNDGTLWV
jgi:hypothetical protein